MSKRFVASAIGVAVATVGIAGAGVAYWSRHDITRSLERASLPKAVDYQALSTASPAPIRAATAVPKLSTVAPQPTTSTLPVEINLAIPFTSQAPFGTWNSPYKEFCEEASALMAVRYLKGEPIANTDAAAAGMLDIQAFEQKEFGYFEDTTAAEVATVLKKHFGIKNVQVVVNPTVADIKTALAAGKPVLVPAAGRLLGNPFYTPPGPLYHMLVIKGYTKNGQFITNDPGTRRGADFLYEPTILMNAMHDWRADGNIEQGRKVVLIVG